MEDIIYCVSYREFDFVDEKTNSRVTGVSFNCFDSNLYPFKFSVSTSKIGPNFQQLILQLDDLKKETCNQNAIIEVISPVAIRPFFNRFGKVATFEFV